MPQASSQRTMVCEHQHHLQERVVHRITKKGHIKD